VALTVADIDRWRAEAVREVFQAATDRGQATLEASRQLRSLAVFDTWQGATAEARRHQNAQIRQDLDAHGEEALAVARAADKAADGIENVQSRLHRLRADAAQLHMTVDAQSNTVVPNATSSGPPVQSVIAEQQLQPRLDAILAEANGVDTELASALNMADGDTRIPADAGPPVGRRGLTPTQRESDANEERLGEERSRLRLGVDRLQALHDRLVAQTATDYPNGVVDSDAVSRLAAMGDQLTAAKNRLGELDCVDQALRNAPETYLTQLQIPGDPRSQVLAAVAVGNPDTAVNLSVAVPGVGSTTRATLPRMVVEARELQLEEIRQLKNAGRPTSVSTIVWAGYTPAPNPLDTDSPRDLWRTVTDGQAKAGAADLSKYLDHLRANNPGGHLTVLGHSYGSLTASLALQNLNAQGHHPVNDVVFYGSPGLELYSPAQLGLEHGQAYVMGAPQDLVVSAVAPLAPVHGWGLDPYGPGSGMTQLSAQAGVDPGGIWRDGVSGHADYSRSFTNAAGQPELRMSGYNLAAIAAGLPDNTVRLPGPPGGVR
jgi:hypothetical protein